MPDVVALTVADVEWAVGVLRARRAALEPHAPLLWRPAPDADECHARFLARLLGDGEGVGVRTDEALMIAVTDRDGWSVDDAWVPPGRWATEGLALWTALTARLGALPATVVCPVPEVERARFVGARGLSVQRSWWHHEGGSTGPVRSGTGTGVGGAEAVLVAAPPVYDPGGPVLFLREVTDHAALGQVLVTAAESEAALVVVDQPVADESLALSLSAQGYVRHCDFFSPAP